MSTDTCLTCASVIPDDFPSEDQCPACALAEAMADAELAAASAALDNGATVAEAADAARLAREALTPRDVAPAAHLPRLTAISGPAEALFVYGRRNGRYGLTPVPFDPRFQADYDRGHAEGAAVAERLVGAGNVLALVEAEADQYETSAEVLFSLLVAAARAYMVESGCDADLTVQALAENLAIAAAPLELARAAAAAHGFDPAIVHAGPAGTLVVDLPSARDRED